MKITDIITSRKFSGIFPKISENIKFPENLQPYNACVIVILM